MRPDEPARAYLEPDLSYPKATELCLIRARDLLEMFSLSNFLTALLESTAGEVLNETYQYLHLGLLVPPGIDESLFSELLAEVGYDHHIRIFPSEVMTLELSRLSGGNKVPTTIFKAFREPDENGVRGIELFAPEAQNRRVLGWIEQGVGAHLGIGLRSREAVVRATELCAKAGFSPPPFLGGRPAVNATEEVLVFYLDGAFDSRPLRLEFYHSRSECERAERQGLLP